MKLSSEEIEAVESEGTLFSYKDKEEWYIGRTFKVSSQWRDEVSNVQTNIRVPMIWAPAFKEGIVPGMNGWDATLLAAYSVRRHPVHMMIVYDDRNDMIVDLMLSSAGNTSAWACNPTAIYRIIDQIWPGAADVNDGEEEDHDRPSLFKLQGITLDNFLGMKASLLTT